MKTFGRHKTGVPKSDVVWYGEIGSWPSCKNVQYFKLLIIKLYEIGLLTRLESRQKCYCPDKKYDRPKKHQYNMC